MGPYTPDPGSIAGKALDVGERTQLLVVGAGAAGIAAALEAAKHGVQVVLVDENPIPSESMGEDVPLLFGDGASGAVRNRTAMMEAVLAGNPGIEAAFDAGVDVRLGTAAWGVFANGASVGWLPGPVAGLADAERSWMLACDHVIVAAGRRDMGLAFSGWDRPGVMGATAVHRLATLYGAFDRRRAVVLGTTADALATACLLRDRGVEIVAIVERASAPVGPDDLLGSLVAGGTPVLQEHVLVRADGGLGGVEAAVAVRVGPDGRHIAGTERSFACDTIILGIAAVPAIELLDALGCRTLFSDARGGYVPDLGERQRCSVPGFHAVGDCAGVWPDKSLDPAIAAAEGRSAARDVAVRLGLAEPLGPAEPDPDTAAAVPTAGAFDVAAYRLAWVRASVVEAVGEPHVCRCEEVTAREILEVRPPRYLNWNRPGRNDRSLRTMLGEGTPHPDQVKRLTRAGMGLCQGRRCREQVQALLALGAGCTLPEVPLASYRAPVRPLPLRLAGQAEEMPAMAEHWDTWFGMVSQYAPPWEIPERYTVAGRKLGDKAASE